jgi:hypothetical protein
MVIWNISIDRPRLFILMLFAGFAAACSWQRVAGWSLSRGFVEMHAASESPTITLEIEHLDPLLDSLIARKPGAFEIANGFRWTEGPL